MDALTDSPVNRSSLRPASKSEWLKSNILWPGLFIVGFALVVAILSILTSAPRDSTKNRVETTYGVTVERMPASLLNDTITVSSSDYSHMIRCSLPSDRDMDERLPMKCKDSTGELIIPAL